MPPPPDLQATGDRINTLLDASASGGVVARERAEELVRLVADLYGAGLERILTIAHSAGKLDDDVLAALADDDLVSNLLLVHDLHPYDAATRVERALAGVRPDLASHGADVELIDVTHEGVLRLRLLGSWQGCGAATLKSTVEDAVQAAAPEIVRVEMGAGTDGAAVASAPVISVNSLWSRVAMADSAVS